MSAALASWRWVDHQLVDANDEPVLTSASDHTLNGIGAHKAMIAAAPTMLAELESILAHEDALSATLAGLAVIAHAKTAIAAATGAA